MTAQEDGKSQNENGIRGAAKIPDETPLSETSFLLPLKSDVIFKLVFGDPRYIDITKAFLSAILGIPADEFADLRIIDPHLERDRPGDKLGILDVRAQMKSGKLISVEIQVRRTPFMAERVAFSTGRNLSRQIAPGQNYKKMEVHTLELTKIPDGRVEDIRERESVSWLRLIRSENREEIEMLGLETREMELAVGRLKQLSADERARMIYEARQLAEMDEMARMEAALEEGIEKGIEKGIEQNKTDTAKKMLAKGFDFETTSLISGLSIEKVQSLK